MNGSNFGKAGRYCLALCAVALVFQGCAEQDTTYSQVSDIGPDAAAGAVLATAELAASDDPTVEFISPINNQTYTYINSTIAVDVETEVTNTGSFIVEYWINGAMKGSKPTDGVFTYTGVSWGRHTLTAQLFDSASGDQFMNPEARASIFIRVTKPCVYDQGPEQCDDGNACSSFTCKNEGNNNGTCTYGPVQNCCSHDMDCGNGEYCWEGSCVECRPDSADGGASDCLGADTCSTPTCQADGSCVYEAVENCCMVDSDCDDGDFCTTEVCNVGQNTCDYVASNDPLCCNVDSDCKPSDPCIAYMCYVNNLDAQQWCRYGPKNANCCETSSDCEDGNPCTLNECVLEAGADSGQCVFNENPALDSCCVVDNDCDDGDDSTIDSCNTVNDTCEHTVDPLYCHMDTQSVVVINEMMIAPGSVPDSAGEWIELYNAADPDDALGLIDLEGWTISTSLGDEHVLTASNATAGVAGMNFFPGQHLVIARSADKTVNGDFSPDYAYGSDISLPDPYETGQAATVTVTLKNAAGEVVDSVTYDTASWGDKLKDGHAVSLTNIYADNSDGTHWATSGSNGDPMLNVDYGSQNLFGTPKQDNDVVRGLPHAGCVVPDDAHACAQGVCSADLRCEFDLTPGCCQADADCDDFDSCTVDSCDVANGLCNPPTVMPECCDSNDECDDGNPCNLDRCIGNVCRYSSNIADNCCMNDLDCDDGDQCTVNSCNILTQECEPAEPVAMAGGQTCCSSSEDCDDSDPSTNDLCNFNTTPPTCLYVDNPEYCDHVDAPCDDGNHCTADFCDVGTSTCVHQQLPGCCEKNSDCVGDGNACTNEVCDVATGDCFTIELDNCCLSNQDCEDDNVCTTDTCTAGNQCHNQQITGCCNEASDCDDGIPCTLDTCFNKQCVQTQEAACCQPGDSPQALIDSCGPDPDGTASCFVWSCSPVGQCIPIQNPSCCNKHDDCNDGDPCTTDICTTDNQCKNLAQSADTCCVANNDCPSDGNVCTTAYCDAGSCSQLAIDGCSTPVEECGPAPGPVVNSEGEGWEISAGSCWRDDTAGALGPDAHIECFSSFGAVGDGALLKSPSFNPDGQDSVSVQFKTAWQVGASGATLTILASSNKDVWSAAEVLDVINLTGSGERSVQVSLSNLMLAQNQIWIGFQVDSDDTAGLKVAIDDYIVATGGQPFFVDGLSTGKNYDLVTDRLLDGGAISSELDQPANKVFWVHDPEWATQDLTFELVNAPPFVTIVDSGKLNLYGVHQVKIQLNATDPADIGEYNLRLKVTDCSFSDEVSVSVKVGLGAGYVLYAPLGVHQEALNGLKAALDANNLTYQQVTDLAEVPDFDQVMAIFVTLGGGPDRVILGASDVSELIDYVDQGGSVYLEGSATWAEDPQTLLHPRFDVAIEAQDGGVFGNMVGVANFNGQSLVYSIFPEMYNDVDHILPVAGGTARKAWQTDASKKGVMLTNVDPVSGARLVASSMLLGLTEQVGTSPQQVVASIVDFLLNGYGPCTSHEQCASGEPCEIATCVGGQCVIEPDVTCDLCQDDGDCQSGFVCLPNGDCVEPDGDEVGDDPTPRQFNCDTTDELIYVVKNVSSFGKISDLHTKIKIVLDPSQKVGTHEIKLIHGGKTVTLMSPDPTKSGTVIDIDFDLGSLPAEGSMNDFVGTNIYGDWVLSIEDTTGGSKCGTLTEWELYTDIGSTGCSSDADCDDGAFCNGQETCNNGACAPGTPAICDDGDGCTVDSCEAYLANGVGACYSGQKLPSCVGKACTGAHAIDSGDGACGELDTCLGGTDGGSGTCQLVCESCAYGATGKVDSTIPPGGCVTEQFDVSGAAEFVTSAAVKLDVTHANIGDLVVKLYSPTNSSIPVVSGMGEGLANFHTTFPTAYEVDMCSLRGVTAEGTWKVQVCNTGTEGGVLHASTVWVGSSNDNPTEGQDCESAIPFSGADGQTDLVGDTSCYANTTAGNCTGGSGHDMVYTFNIPVAKRITVDLFTPTWDGGVYITNSCNLGSTLCADSKLVGESESIDTILQPGTWFLVVDSFSASQRGPWDMSVRLHTPLANGQACTEALDCQSGHCQNGYCCDSGDCCNTGAACPGSYTAAPICHQPDDCQGYRTDATCIANQCGSVNVDDDQACDNGTEADTCGLYDSVFCSGQTTQVTPSCPSSCVNDAQCDDGAHCNESSATCRVNLNNGIQCARDGHCASGQCVDGVCCDSSCGGNCESCVTPGAVGQCKMISNGADPDNECAGEGLCGGVCDGSGQCRFTAPTTGCAECMRCDGAGFCSNPVPANTDLDDSCSLCNVCDGSGACTLVAEGQDTLNECAAQAAGSCGQDGTCDGAGACRLHVAGTVCVNQSCSSGYVDPNHTCDGVGNCVNHEDIFCDGKICDAANCRASCNGNDNNCIAGYYCDDLGSQDCKPKKQQGEACAQDHQCQSGYCTDGVCCDSLCAGPCRNCGLAASASTCSQVNLGATSVGFPDVCGGTPGTGASPLGDGPCVNSATYDEAVESCISKGMRLCRIDELEIGEAKGTGCGHDDRQIWSATSCGANKYWTLKGNDLQGANGSKTCTAFDVAGAAVRCCADAAGLGAAGSCDNAGAFSDPEDGCGLYWCNGSGSCKNYCSVDADCKDGNYCNGSVCEPKKTNGTGCSAGNQCASGVCNLEDGVCCDRACDSVCESCKLAGNVGTCQYISSGADPDEECTGTHGTCGGTCNGAGSCQLPSSTTSCGTCRRCDGAGDCAYVAKNTDPDNNCSTCRTCNGTGSCMAVPVDEDPQDDCAAANQTTCGFTGKCSGNSSCQYWGNDAVVEGQSCSNSIAHPGKTCNGAGSVVDPGSYSCQEYACGGNVCRTTCSAHNQCASGYICDFQDSDQDNRTDDCVAKKDNGSQCSADAECNSNHCQNGFCCNSGNCCAQSSDCDFMGSPAVCDSKSAGGCDGHRIDAYCNGNNKCKTVTVDDDSACASQQCAGSFCSGKAHTTTRFCNATGQCSIGGDTVSCDDGNPCTNDHCSAGNGCSHTDNNGLGFGCYLGPAGTQNVGICKGGTRYCSGGMVGQCQGQVLPQTEKCGDNLDNDCDGLVNEQGAAGCTIYYRDNDGDGYGQNDARCLCSKSYPFTATKQGDCNDGNANINPGQSEKCWTGYDDNCNSVANENNAAGCSNYYLDGDSDGYGIGGARCQCGASDPFNATGSGDCNDSNANINPGKPERCNGFDDNCNGLVDGSEASGVSLCGGVANVPNWAIQCSIGQCGFTGCNHRAHNVDGFFYNGCERVEDTWDQQNRGDSCGHSSSQAVNIDSDMWENENHYVTANILPSGDRDWWKVKPRDGGTPGRDFSIDVRFSSNPGHNMAGGTHRFSVYRDSCGNRVCYNASVFQKRTNFNKNGGGCTNGNQCGHVGNQNCTSTAGNNHCGSSTRKCCHHSSDNNRWFFVEVWHTSGRAMNADYQLRFSNNHY